MQRPAQLHEAERENYEAMGHITLPASSYQRFLDLWRDADPELQPQVVEVRRRLAGLTAERPSS